MNEAKTSASSLYERLLAGAGLPDVAHGRLRTSASVVLWRLAAQGSKEPGELEVFWVQRSPRLRFMGGWHAFPGGALDPADSHQPAGAPPVAHGPDFVPGLELCALRELFEETGVLPLRGIATGTVVDAETRACLDRARSQLLDDGGSLPQALRDAGLASSLSPDSSRLVFAGRWRTPPFTPVRFDNRFFLLHWPATEALQPRVLPGELAGGEWISPGAALDAWRHGDVITSPPILHLLRVLASDGPEAGLPRLRSVAEGHLGPFRRFEFRPGIITLPLVTPTLPPAAHTNAFLLGHGEVVLVDPGSPLPEQQRALLDALADAQTQGLRLKAIWLTHHHPDHVGAVEAVRAAFRVPVLAHEATAARLATATFGDGAFGRDALEVDGLLEADQRITLAGTPTMTLRVLHTPGHAPGHLAFLEESTGCLIAGDLVAGLGTIVIDPPDGDMSAYLDSLTRVAALAPRVLFPAHGPPLYDAVRQLKKLKQHRLWREERIHEAWEQGKRTLDELVAAVYPDLDPRAQPLAERQVAAHVDRLRDQHRLG